MGEGCDVGLFVCFRFGIEMKCGVCIGNFVEIKNIIMEEGVKVSYLIYLGDSEIGCDVNIGVGIIICNYDGVNKYKMIIGEGVFIGLNLVLVVLVDIGVGVIIGVGLMIIKSVKENVLIFIWVK